MLSSNPLLSEQGPRFQKLQEEQREERKGDCSACEQQMCVILDMLLQKSFSAADAAHGVVSSISPRLQSQLPNAFMAIPKDFNHTSLSATLPTFYQFLNCSIRENKTLDLLFANKRHRPNLKELMNKKKRALRDGVRDLWRGMQRELKARQRESKDACRRKLENKLQQNTVWDVWSDIKRIAGFKAKGNQAEGDLNRANELNVFFNRFRTSPPAAPSYSSRCTALGLE